MNKYFVYKQGQWFHRTPLKVFLNPILRFIQFWTDTPYVIASVVEFKEVSPVFLNYEFKRVKYLGPFPK